MDPRPQEYLSAEALRTAVAIKAGELLARDGGEGNLDFRFRIDAEDEAGVVVYSLRLEDAARGQHDEVRLLHELRPDSEAARENEGA